jgi:hypothetical protein
MYKPKKLLEENDMKKGFLFIVMMIAVLMVVQVLPCQAQQSDLINACYQKNNGQLRIVKAATECRSSEVAISWNVAGQPRPAFELPYDGTVKSDNKPAFKVTNTGDRVGISSVGGGSREGGYFIGGTPETGTARGGIGVMGIGGTGKGGMDGGPGGHFEGRAPNGTGLLAFAARDGGTGFGGYFEGAPNGVGIYAKAQKQAAWFVGDVRVQGNIVVYASDGDLILKSPAPDSKCYALKVAAGGTLSAVDLGGCPYIVP